VSHRPRAAGASSPPGTGSPRAYAIVSSVVIAAPSSHARWASPGLSSRSA
jgi:hypothetical protein